MHHLVALFKHFIPLLFDELNLAGKFDLCLAQIVQGLLLHLNELLDLRGKKDGTDSVPREDLIDQEEGTLMLTEFVLN